MSIRVTAAQLDASLSCITATDLVRSYQLPAAQFVLHAVSAKARWEKAEASLNAIANALQARVRKAR